MGLSSVMSSTPAVMMGFAFDGLNVLSAGTTFKNSLDDGDNPVVATTKGIIDFGVSEAFYGAMGNGTLKGGLVGMAATTGISVGAGLVASSMQNTGSVLGKGSEEAKYLGSGHFNMTQAGYTMRQRSLNAIQSNGANINMAFGNEARNYYIGL